METIFLGVVIFLLLLAIFDLTVGVSNDAVNFLSSSLGCRAASFRRVLIVASIGVFLGAAMSNGMMDIARHGIFRPEHFSFYELMCIFMAVIIADVILLDTFNTLGLPTSTTVSMVFELLGASFVVALIKMGGDGAAFNIGDLLNTGKALTVIVAIFVSVALAFVFGTLVQFITRAIFSFDYRSRLRWKIGIFGGICLTAIVYFLLIKGLSGMSFMNPAVIEWIHGHTLAIVGGCLVVFTIGMQLLHFAGVNVLKVIVLTGTFALAMAFAGNDLVNFIGVPLTGLASFQDFTANGAGDVHGHMMGVLNSPANTPVYFLVIAGLVMVIALATSRKARNVSKTQLGLSSQGGGDELFGSSRLAQSMVRRSLAIANWWMVHTPPRLRRWLGRRFDTSQSQMEPGQAFDLVRGSVNLVLAGALIAVGTAMRLPLSTTFVTFMVAMGTSLADRAWGRESAVFRITGVIAVIGGWFLTAGAAFLGAGIIVMATYWGGPWIMLALAAVTIYIIVRSNLKHKKSDDATAAATDAATITAITKAQPDQAWPMLAQYITDSQVRFLQFADSQYRAVTDAFLTDNNKALNASDRVLSAQKAVLKSTRRNQTLCLGHVSRRVAIAQSAFFHLGTNSCMSMLYNLRRICEVCREHVSNNFALLPEAYRDQYHAIQTNVSVIMEDAIIVMQHGDSVAADALRQRCDGLKRIVADAYHSLHEPLRQADASTMTSLYVYLNMLYETREFVSSLRKLMRANAKMTEGFTVPRVADAEAGQSVDLNSAKAMSVAPA